MKFSFGAVRTAPLRSRLRMGCRGADGDGHGAARMGCRGADASGLRESRLALSQLVASACERPADDQKGATYSDVENIEHIRYSVSAKITSWPAWASLLANR